MRDSSVYMTDLMQQFNNNIIHIIMMSAIGGYATYNLEHSLDKTFFRIIAASPRYIITLFLRQSIAHLGVARTCKMKMSSAYFPRNRHHVLPSTTADIMRHCHAIKLIHIMSLRHTHYNIRMSCLPTLCSHDRWVSAGARHVTYDVTQQSTRDSSCCHYRNWMQRRAVRTGMETGYTVMFSDGRQSKWTVLVIYRSGRCADWTHTS